MGKLWGNKLFLAGGSFVVLLALGVVLGLTIVRIQNQQATITQPKASGVAVTWPACATAGPGYKCEASGNCYVDGGPDNQNIVKCCAKLGAGGSIYECAWPARGWCTPTQCDASEKDPNAGCHTNKDGTQDCHTKGGHCGLYFYNSDSGCYNYGKCTVGKAVSPSITNGQINVSTTPTLNWTYSPYPDGGTPYASVYLWSCSARSDDCGVFAFATTTGQDLADLVGVTSFYKPTGKGQNFLAGEWQVNPNYYVKSLKPNTQYWWQVNPGVQGCGVAKDLVDTWTFTTGTGSTTPTEICWNNIDDNGDGNQDEGCTCPANPCPSGKVCTNGSCVVSGTTANECEVCGGGNTKSCNTGLKCSGTSSTVGVCIKNDGTTSCGSCTTDNDCLLKALVCVNDSCGDPSSSHLGCGTNSTCVRKSGAGSNTDSCTAVGGTCGTTTNEVNACWGNGGTSGKCYDCNGDGEVNILDFSCFRNKYSQNVQ